MGDYVDDVTPYATNYKNRPRRAVNFFCQFFLKIISAVLDVRLSRPYTTLQTNKFFFIFIIYYRHELQHKVY